MDGKLYHLPFGDSSVSLNGTMQSGKSQQSYVPFALRWERLFQDRMYDCSGWADKRWVVLLLPSGRMDWTTARLTSPWTTRRCSSTKRRSIRTVSSLIPHPRRFSFRTSPNPLPVHNVDHDSDSDSDLSLEDDQSGSYTSTHSSDSEDEEGPVPPEECWEKLASNGTKRPQAQGTDSKIIQKMFEIPTLLFMYTFCGRPNRHRVIFDRVSFHNLSSSLLTSVYQLKSQQNSTNFIGLRLWCYDRKLFSIAWHQTHFSPYLL